MKNTEVHPLAKSLNTVSTIPMPTVHFSYLYFVVVAKVYRNKQQVGSLVRSRIILNNLKRPRISNSKMECNRGIGGKHSHFFFS